MFMDTKLKTFKDIKKFLETAERDEIGYHYMNKNFPKIIIHIYDGYREANIHIDQDGNICHDMIIGKIYFDNDRVSLIPVNRGCALYDESVKVNIDTDINDINVSKILNRVYKSYSAIMKNVLINMALNVK